MKICGFAANVRFEPPANRHFRARLAQRPPARCTSLVMKGYAVRIRASAPGPASNFGHFADLPGSRWSSAGHASHGVIPPPLSPRRRSGPGGDDLTRGACGPGRPSVHGSPQFEAPSRHAQGGWGSRWDGYARGWATGRFRRAIGAALRKHPARSTGEAQGTNSDPARRQPALCRKKGIGLSLQPVLVLAG